MTAQSCQRCGAGTAAAECPSTADHTPKRCRCRPAQLADFRARQTELPMAIPAVPAPNRPNAQGRLL